MSPTLQITLCIISFILFLASTAMRIYLAYRYKKHHRPNKFWADDLLWFLLMLLFAFISSFLYGTMPWLEGGSLW